jgi:L-seryl-tRNA(Ser) seleniumtransferase
LIHTGNYAIVGSSTSVTIEELVGLGRRHQLPVIHNLGAGTLIDLQPFGITGQPMIGASIKAGADLVLLSGDKLLGGPQCGIILGRKVLIDQLEHHPMARALRADKLTLAALAATLRLYKNPEKARIDIPLLRLLTTSIENLKNRAERLAPQAAATAAIAQAEAITSVTHLDWGMPPTQELPTWCVALRPASMTLERLAAVLRMGATPVVGRLEEDRLLLDLRSVFPRQDMQLITALEALGSAETIEQK